MLGQFCAGVKPNESTQIPKYTRTNLKTKKSILMRVSVCSRARACVYNYLVVS